MWGRGRAWGWGGTGWKRRREHDEIVLVSEASMRSHRSIPSQFATPPAAPTRREQFLELDFSVMTALYGGGAEAGKNDVEDPFRVPSIRGHLRFWWRATIGGRFTDVESLRRAEAKVWGDTDQASGVRVPRTACGSGNGAARCQHWVRRTLAEGPARLRFVPGTGGPQTNWEPLLRGQIPARGFGARGRARRRGRRSVGVGDVRRHRREDAAGRRFAPLCAVHVHMEGGSDTRRRKQPAVACVEGRLRSYGFPETGVAEMLDRVHQSAS